MIASPAANDTSRGGAEVRRAPVAGPAGLRVVVNRVSDDVLFLSEALAGLRGQSERHRSPLRLRIFRIGLAAARRDANAKISDDEVPVLRAPDRGLSFLAARQNFEPKELDPLERGLGHDDVGILRRVLTGCHDGGVVLDRQRHALSGVGGDRVDSRPLDFGAERRKPSRPLRHAARDLGIDLLLAFSDFRVWYPEVGLIGIVEEGE